MYGGVLYNNDKTELILYLPFNNELNKTSFVAPDTVLEIAPYGV